jgi:EAL domain-containing protein (putative c-di-GMP-specific phosphodiesterase class I)/FixJ family two-component response regulator
MLDVVAKTRPIASSGLILLVEDEPLVLSAYGRILREAGFSVIQLPNAALLEETLAVFSPDAVISDVRLPGPSGIDVLRAVRARDPDVPVILITAGGDLTSAVEAVEHGALRYLLKPIAPAALAGAAADAVRLRRFSVTERRAFELYGSAAVRETTKVDLSAQFERALQTLELAYQPIVSWSERSVFAYEALARNREPALRAPDVLFNAAEKLGRVFDVGRIVRRFAAEALASQGPPCLFVNLHPLDLEDEELFADASPLSRVASKVVLEITERASLAGVADLSARLTRLRHMGYRLAVDDLGAGYAGLNWVAQLEPDVVKLDQSLTRSVDRELTKRKLVQSMVRLCSELGTIVTGECVETKAERDALLAAGCDLLQGYLFAKPGPAFPTADLGD